VGIKAEDYRRPQSIGVQDRDAVSLPHDGSAASPLCLVVKPDFTIVDATEEYLVATLLWRQEISDCNLFDVFPDNPHDRGADGAANLRASLNEVLRNGIPDVMKVQRYDVRDHATGSQAWVEKFWAPTNTAVFGAGSREITYLIHEVVDVTHAVLLRRWVEEQSIAVAEQRDTLERMLRDLAQRERNLRAHHEQLNVLAGRRGSYDFSAARIQVQLGAPEMRRYFYPGDHAPVTGVYEAFHFRRCEWASSRVFERAGQAFPVCRDCKKRVVFRLFKACEWT
jgi:hypothetical protein